MIEEIIKLSKANAVTVGLSVFGRRGEEGERRFVATIYPPHHRGFGEYGKTPEDALRATLARCRVEFAPTLPTLPTLPKLPTAPALPTLPKLPNV